MRKAKMIFFFYILYMVLLSFFRLVREYLSEEFHLGFIRYYLKCSGIEIEKLDRN